MAAFEHQSALRDFHHHRGIRFDHWSLMNIFSKLSSALAAAALLCAFALPACAQSYVTSAPQIQPYGPYVVGSAPGDLVTLNAEGLLPLGILPAISASSQTGATPCDQMVTAENESIAGPIGQDILIDFPVADLSCPTSPIISNFAGNIVMNSGHTFHMWNGASWILPSKTLVIGSGSGSPGIGVFTIQACNALDTSHAAFCNSGSQTPDTPNICFITCSTSASAQGYGTQMIHFTSDCNGVPGCTAMFNEAAQENSGAYDADLRGWDNNGRGLWVGTSSASGSGGNATYQLLNLTNSVANPWRFCQEGAVGIYLDAIAGGPKKVTGITIGNTYCKTLSTTNGWAAYPLYNMEVVAASTPITDKPHFETFEVAGALMGGKTPGYGAYFTATTSGGNITATTQVSGGLAYTAPTVKVFPTTCTGGTLTPNLISGVITSLTISGTFTGCGTSASVLISISDAVTTGGSTAVSITNPEACCVDAAYQATASVVAVALGATAEKSLTIKSAACGSPNAPTNLIADANHLTISCTAASRSEDEYSTDAAGNVQIDTSQVNPNGLVPYASFGTTVANVVRMIGHTPDGTTAGPISDFLPGVNGRVQNNATGTGIVATDCGTRVVYQSYTGAGTDTLPTAATLGVPKCNFKLAIPVTLASGSPNPVTQVTITAAGTINGAGTFVLYAGQVASFFVDPAVATNFDADIVPKNAFNSVLTIAAGGNSATTAQFSQYAMFYAPNTMASTATVNLPTCLTCFAGQWITVQNYSSSVVNINPTASGLTLNGGTANLQLLAASETAPTAAIVFFDGANFEGYLVGQGTVPNAVDVNGAVVPASATFLSTNSSRQLIAGASFPLASLAAQAAYTAVANLTNASAVPTAVAVQGTDSKLMSAGTVSTSAAIALCTDANGGATTSGCPANTAAAIAAGGNSPTAAQFAESAMFYAPNSMASTATVNLPTCATCLIGQWITVANYSSSVVNINPTASGLTLNGGTANLVLAAASETAPTSATIYFDGTNFEGYLSGQGTAPNTVDVNGAAVPASAAFVKTNSSNQLVAGTALPLASLAAQAAYTVVANQTNASAVPTAVSVQGTDSKLMSAGTVSASTGVALCTDANGGLTTTGCAGAGITGTWTSTGNALGTNGAGAAQDLGYTAYAPMVLTSSFTNSTTSITAIITSGTIAAGAVITGTCTGIYNISTAVAPARFSISTTVAAQAIEFGMFATYSGSGASVGTAAQTTGGGILQTGGNVAAVGTNYPFSLNFVIQWNASTAGTFTLGGATGTSSDAINIGAYQAECHINQ
jgi:hypothetical protein